MDKKDSKVLSDHKRYKSKFIPPLKHALKNVKEVSWKKHNLPELFWIRLLHHNYGLKDGNEIAIKFTKECANKCDLEPKPLFASITSFNNLNIEAKHKVLEALHTNEIYINLIEALGPLLSYYPECPLNFLSDSKSYELYKTERSIEILKEAIKPLFDKLERDTIFTQATFVYLGLLQGKIKICKGMSLENFSEIERYPDTEISKRIASSIRSIISILENGDNYQWSDYFWDRGLKITPCS